MLITTTTAVAQWNVMEATGVVGMSNIHFTNSSVGFGVGTNFQDSWIQKTTDGGKSWRADLLTGSFLFGLNASDPTTIFAAGHYIECNCAIVLRSSDAGVSWQGSIDEASFGFYDLEFPTPNIGYTGGYNGIINKTTDNGETWVTLNSGSNSDVFLDLDFPSVNTGFALAGIDGNFFSATRIYMTADAGATWEILQDFEDGTTLNDVKFRTPQNGMMVGSIENIATVFLTEDGGKNWSIVYQYTKEEALFPKIQLVDENSPYVIGTNGIILHTTDGGVTWIEEPSGSSATFLDIALAGDKPLITTDDSMLLERVGDASSVSTNSHRSSENTLSLTITPSVVASEAPIVVEGTWGNGTYMLHLYDQLGRTLQTVTIPPGQKTLHVQTKDLPQGIYFWQVLGENQSSAIHQMVVQ